MCGSDATATPARLLDLTGDATRENARSNQGLVMGLFAGVIGHGVLSVPVIKWLLSELGGSGL